MLMLALVLPGPWCMPRSCFTGLSFPLFYVVVLFLVLMAGIYTPWKLASWRPGRPGWWSPGAGSAAPGAGSAMKAKGRCWSAAGPAMVQGCRPCCRRMPLCCSRHLCEWLTVMPPVVCPAASPRSPGSVPSFRIEPLQSGVPLFAAFWPYSGIPQGGAVGG